jgi:hypothetical protein
LAEKEKSRSFAALRMTASFLINKPLTRFPAEKMIGGEREKQILRLRASRSAQDDGFFFKSSERVGLI